MAAKMLRVRSRGDALVQDYAAMDAGVRRFIGWRRDASLRDEAAAIDGGFVSTGADVELPFRAEYVTALKDGSLWPADKATAELAGVPFDPNFGESPAAQPEPRDSKKKG